MADPTFAPAPAATWDAQVAEALAFELAEAALVAAAVRRALAALTTAVLVEARKALLLTPSGPLPATAQARIRKAFTDRLPTLVVDLTPAVQRTVERAVHLAVRQETTALAGLGPISPDPAAIATDVLHDPLLAHAGRDAARNLAARVDRIAKMATAAPLRTEKQVRALAASAASAANTVERDVRTVANRAINTTTAQIVKAFVPTPEPLTVQTPTVSTGDVDRVFGQIVEQLAGPPAPPLPAAPEPKPELRVVWVAERQACLTCKALSGQVADPATGTWFDEFATFSPHGAPQVWPPGQPLMGPPRHPHCRCRLRIIAANNTAVPDALRREAERAVLRGWSDHDSRRARLTAADRLLAHGTTLPVTVQHRAAADIEAGRFSTRHRPRATQLRAD